MKRTPVRTSGKSNNPRTRLHARQKAIQACASCRKSKTRCEILRNIKPGVPVQCHRCEVLHATCSYSEMESSLFKSKEAPPGPEPPIGKSGEGSQKANFESPIVKLIREASLKMRRPDPPGPSPPFWFFLRDYDVDWTAPMTGIYEITTKIYQPSYQSDPPMNSITSLHQESYPQVIDAHQISHLLNIFTQRYVPWLNFNLMRSTEGELLDLACCTIAVRHLDPPLRAVITPQLQKLMEDMIVKMMLNLKESQSLEAIQSLLIVSLWTPICGYESKLKDVQSLLSTAVGMAMNMRLHEASERAIAMRESFQKEDGSFASKQEIVDGMNRARLWVAVTNIESIMCLGTLRTPLSRRTSSDIRLILLTPRAPSTEQECRDIRLRLGAELYDIVEGTDMSDVINFEGIEPWFLARKESLEEINRVQRILLPLPTVADHERTYFKAMLVILRMSRLLVLYRTLEQARMSPINPKLFPLGFLHVRVHDQPVLVPIGREVVQLSEAITVLLLELDVPTLSTAPNTFFFMMNFVGALSTATKFMMIRHFGFELPGSADAVMERVPKLLMEAALSEDHFATRAAKFFEMINMMWGRRHIEAADSTLSSNFATPSPPTDASSPNSSQSFTSAVQPHVFDPSSSTSASPMAHSSPESYMPFEGSQFTDTMPQAADLTKSPDMSMGLDLDSLAFQYPQQDFVPFQDYQTGGGGGDYTDGMFWNPNLAPQEQDPEFWAQFFNTGAGFGTAPEAP